MRLSLSVLKLAKRKRIQTAAAEADRIGRPRVSSSSSSCGDSRGVAMGSRQMHPNAAEPITQKRPANCPSGSARSAGHTLSLANKAAPIVKREKEM